MSDLRRTVLYSDHLQLGAKMVPFAGWEMPVQYPLGLRGEHDATRHAAGLFDVSHMGEIRVTGPLALELLQKVTTNDVSKLNAFEAHYSLIPNPQGGIVDDIIVYCLEPEMDYLVCVNASNRAKDYQYFEEQNQEVGADLSDQGDYWGQIAIQGPNAVAISAIIFGPRVSDIAPFKFQKLQYHDQEVLVARTGYTGEDGFEVFVPSALTSTLWNEFLKVGRVHGLEPCGLGARDTLRTEVKYPLYGQELTDAINPYSAGLGWVVKPDAKDFVGKDIMLAQKSQALQKKLIGYKLLEKGIPRHDYPFVDANGQNIGITTSGTYSPTLNEGIGIGYINSEFAKVGTEFYVSVRSRNVKAIVVTTPFVKTK